MKPVARVKNKRHSDKRRTGRGFCRERVDIPKGMLRFAKMCDNYSYGDWFNSNHVRGIFNKYVGKPWDDCHSHLRAACPTRFFGDIVAQIYHPVWVKEYTIDLVIRHQITYIIDGVKQKGMDYEYEVVGEELVPAGWVYQTRNYGHNYSTLEWLTSHAYYRAIHYVDGDTGIVCRIPAQKDCPTVQQVPYLDYWYQKRKYVKVIKETTTDGTTEKDRVWARFYAKYDANRKEKLLRDKVEAVKPKPQYKIQSKGYHKVEILNDDYEFEFIEEPILVLKRIKT